MRPSREDVEAWLEGLDNGYAVPEFTRVLAAAYIDFLERFVEEPDPRQLELPGVRPSTGGP